MKRASIVLTLFAASALAQAPAPPPDREPLPDEWGYRPPWKVRRVESYSRAAQSRRERSRR